MTLYEIEEEKNSKVDQEHSNKIFAIYSTRLEAGANLMNETLPDA